jgi:hypothetical protein
MTLFVLATQARRRTVGKRLSERAKRTPRTAKQRFQGAELRSGNQGLHFSGWPAWAVQSGVTFTAFVCRARRVAMAKQIRGWHRRRVVFKELPGRQLEVLSARMGGDEPEVLPAKSVACSVARVLRQLTLEKLLSLAHTLPTGHAFCSGGGLGYNSSLINLGASAGYGVGRIVQGLFFVFPSWFADPTVRARRVIQIRRRDTKHGSGRRKGRPPLTSGCSRRRGPLGSEAAPRLSAVVRQHRY